MVTALTFSPVTTFNKIIRHLQLKGGAYDSSVNFDCEA